MYEYHYITLEIKIAKLFEQGIINYKDFSKEIFTILNSKREEFIYRMKLASNEFPTAVYTFSDKLCSNSFKITTYDVAAGIIVNIVTFP